MNNNSQLIILYIHVPFDVVPIPGTFCWSILSTAYQTSMQDLRGGNSDFIWNEIWNKTGFAYSQSLSLFHTHKHQKSVWCPRSLSCCQAPRQECSVCPATVGHRDGCVHMWGPGSVAMTGSTRIPAGLSSHVLLSSWTMRRFGIWLFVPFWSWWWSVCLSCLNFITPQQSIPFFASPSECLVKLQVYVLESWQCSVADYYPAAAVWPLVASVFSLNQNVIESQRTLISWKPYIRPTLASEKPLLITWLG